MNTASGAVPAVAPDARQEVSTGAVSASVSMPAMLTALSAFFSLNRCPAPEMPESSPDEELLAIAEPAYAQMMYPVTSCMQHSSRSLWNMSKGVERGGGG